ncbi:hypothetical protein ACFWH4_01610 [Streptomyces sp. NPDC127091]|uniref:hypothetical protein n=1 Tax=Streptomyces sp. NPDC127091 TaxID=3347134 RepID=UPI0036635488
MAANFEITNDRRTVDLRVSGIPGIQLPNGTAVEPVGVRVNYSRAPYGDRVDVRVEGRDGEGWLDYYDLKGPETWPTWLTELVEKYRPTEPIAPNDGK